MHGLAPDVRYQSGHYGRVDRDAKEFSQIRYKKKLLMEDIQWPFQNNNDRFLYFYFYFWGAYEF
jgi:hypothetical protein